MRFARVPPMKWQKSGAKPPYLLLLNSHHCTTTTHNNVVHLLAESISCHIQPRGHHFHVCSLSRSSSLLLCRLILALCRSLSRFASVKPSLGNIMSTTLSFVNIGRLRFLKIKASRFGFRFAKNTLTLKMWFSCYSRRHSRQKNAGCPNYVRVISRQEKIAFLIDPLWGLLRDDPPPPPESARTAFVWSFARTLTS